MRNHKLIVIDKEGRDKGKTFKITEMPAMKAEKWATRALLALLHSGIEVPDDAANAGLAGIAAMGIAAFAGLKWQDADPLLEEMMTCVQIIPDASNPMVVRPIMEMADDIEEVSTLFFLRKEVLELHLGFSIADKLSTSALSATKKETTSNA